MIVVDTNVVKKVLDIFYLSITMDDVAFLVVGMLAHNDDDIKCGVFSNST